MSEENTSTGTIYAAFLQLLLIGFKLIHVIDWSWWLILSPIISLVVLTIMTLGVTALWIKEISN